MKRLAPAPAAGAPYPAAAASNSGAVGGGVGAGSGGAGGAEDETTPGAAASSDSGVTPTPQSASLHSERRRTKTTNACLSCQRRRIKCNGSHPCESCVTLGVECFFDPTRDGRRRGNVKAPDPQTELAMAKRRLQQLEEQNLRYKRLLEALRSSEEPEFNRIALLLREAEGPSDLSELVWERRRESESSDNSAAAAIATTTGEAAPRLSTRSHFVSSLWDEPLIIVQAYPWTSVTSDDAFVSHLISLWFSWHSPFSSWVEQVLFVRGMLSGDTSSPYCSKFLVNAICAQACPFSNYPESYARPGDPSSSGLHFLDSALVELQLEGGRLSLTNLQGLVILFSVLCSAGKDRLAWTYLAVLAQNYTHFLASPDDWYNIDSSDDRHELYQAIDQASWGIFIFVTDCTIAWGRAPEILAPSRPRSRPRHDIAVAVQPNWVPYPNRGPTATIHVDCYVSARCDASVILREMNELLFAKPTMRAPRSWSHTHRTSIEQGLVALEKWHEQLPDCLAVQRRATAPCILALHINYYAAILATMLQMRAVLPDDGSDAARALRNNLLRNAAQAALSVCELADAFQNDWGAERLSLLGSQGIILALFALLDAPLRDERHGQAFTSLCRVAQSISRVWTLTKGQLRLVQLTARHLGIPLPAEADRVLRDFEHRAWTRRDVSRYSSMFINHTLRARNSTSSTHSISLDVLLQEWDAWSEDEETAAAAAA